MYHMEEVSRIVFIFQSICRNITCDIESIMIQGSYGLESREKSINGKVGQGKSGEARERFSIEPKGEGNYLNTFCGKFS